MRTAYEIWAYARATVIILGLCLPLRLVVACVPPRARARLDAIGEWLTARWLSPWRMPDGTIRRKPVQLEVEGP